MWNCLLLSIKASEANHSIKEVIQPSTSTCKFMTYNKILLTCKTGQLPFATTLNLRLKSKMGSVCLWKWSSILATNTYSSRNLGIFMCKKPEDKKLGERQTQVQPALTELQSLHSLVTAEARQCQNREVGPAGGHLAAVRTSFFWNRGSASQAGPW